MSVKKKKKRSFRNLCPKYMFTWKCRFLICSPNLTEMGFVFVFLLFFFFTVRQSCLKFHCENRSLILCTDYCFCSALFSSLLIPGMVQTFLKGLTQLC